MKARPGTFLRALVLALGAASCENDLVLDEPERGAPPQASVVTSSGAITVHWTSLDDASGYRVLVSETSNAPGVVAVCDGQGASHASPCTVSGKTPGQLYYVRVKSIADDGETDDDPDDDDLPALAVRAGFPGIPRTPFTWAGTGVLGEEPDSYTVALIGMWFEDAAVPGATHTCSVYWDEEQEPELDPCTNEDLAEQSSAGSTLWGECKADACYPVFEVESDDGRRGQSYTRVRGR